MTIDEMINVLQAHKEGKTLEFINKEYGEWEVTKNPSWDFVRYKYRVKKEPHYRPFMKIEEIDKAIKEHGNFLKPKDGGLQHRVGIIEYNDTYVWFGFNPSSPLTPAEVFERFTFADGTPFGKLVEK